VIGVVVIVAVLVVVLPVLIVMSGAIVAFILGSAAKTNAERTHPDSPFIDLNQ
jgi:hypothetical protein